MCTGVIQFSPQALAARIEMPVKPTKEFINRKQGSMLLRDYSLKLVRFYSQERPPNKKCGIIHRGECMMDPNA